VGNRRHESSKVHDSSETEWWYSYPKVILSITENKQKLNSGSGKKLPPGRVTLPSVFISAVHLHLDPKHKRVF
jgi:hypothetical protein